MYTIVKISVAQSVHFNSIMNNVDAYSLWYTVRIKNCADSLINHIAEIGTNSNHRG